MKATARMKTTTDFTNSTDCSAYFNEKDKRKSTNGNNIVTYVDKKYLTAIKYYLPVITENSLENFIVTS